jgi:hypothetical protein
MVDELFLQEKIGVNLIQNIANINDMKFALCNFTAQ